MKDQRPGVRGSVYNGKSDRAKPQYRKQGQGNDKVKSAFGTWKMRFRFYGYGDFHRARKKNASLTVDRINERAGRAAEFGRHRQAAFEIIHVDVLHLL